MSKIKSSQDYHFSNYVSLIIGNNSVFLIKDHLLLINIRDTFITIIYVLLIEDNAFVIIIQYSKRVISYKSNTFSKISPFEYFHQNDIINLWITYLNIFCADNSYDYRFNSLHLKS
jgi:hypothetical protein